MELGKFEGENRALYLSPTPLTLNDKLATEFGVL